MKIRGRRTKPQNVPVLIRIQPGEKLLWRKERDDWARYVVDAHVQK